VPDRGDDAIREVHDRLTPQTPTPFTMLNVNRTGEAAGVESWGVAGGVGVGARARVGAAAMMIPTAAAREDVECTVAAAGAAAPLVFVPLHSSRILKKPEIQKACVASPRAATVERGNKKEEEETMEEEDQDAEKGEGKQK